MEDASAAITLAEAVVATWNPSRPLKPGASDRLWFKLLGSPEGPDFAALCVPEERVRDLTQKIAGVEKRIGDTQTKIGHKNGSLLSLEETRKTQADRLRTVEKAAQVNKTLIIKRDVADDILALARGTLTVLETDYLERVSTRMKGLFMQIVGSDPGFEAVVHVRDCSARSFERNMPQAAT